MGHFNGYTVMQFEVSRLMNFELHHQHIPFDRLQNSHPTANLFEASHAENQ
jgi:hypothetical protein